MTNAPLAIIIHSGGFDRVHYALALAAAAAATGRPTTMLFAGRSLTALLAGEDTPRWHALDPSEDGTAPAERDARLSARGVGGIEELLAAAIAVGVRFLVCEMALHSRDETDRALRADIPAHVAGLVTLLAASGTTTPLFV